MRDDFLIGKQLDEYRLEELLGQGGMARVYRAFDTRLKRRVAIKVIATPFRSNSDYMLRFEREAQAIAQLEHPNVVNVYRYGEVADMLYIAMQYVEGMSLDTLLRTYHQEGNYIPPAEALKIIRDVCQALDYIHRQGVIHRDVKPANIMLNKQGNAILTDFGLALLENVGTRGEILGTPHYLAPEQAISSAGAVPQSDLYAVGVILYEMFTGAVPFDAGSAMSVALMHMSEPPEPLRRIRPQIKRAVEKVILKALEKEPENRYESGAKLVAALEKALRVSEEATSVPPAQSIMERVAVDLAARPLPPLPAGVSPKQPFKTEPGSRQAPAVSSRGSNPLVYVMVGAAVSVLMIFVIAGGALWWLGVLSPGSLNNLLAETNRSTNGEGASPTALGAADLVLPTPTSSPTILPPTEVTAAQPTATSSPTPTETPLSALPTLTNTPIATTVPAPPTSTDTPVPALPSPTATLTGTPAPAPDTPTPTSTPEPPRPIADTRSDFSGAQIASNWEYQWSRGRESFDWAQMQFDGTCWRTDNSENSVRICQESGHPGITGDIAWRWLSPVGGSVWIQVSARKLDTGGGDGVIILVYRNTTEVKRWQLGANDSVGFSEGFTLDVAEEDFIFFVMKVGGDSTYDHTAFRVQIYRR